MNSSTDISDFRFQISASDGKAEPRGNNMGYLRGAKVNNSTIKEQLVDVLRNQILNRTLLPGQQLNIDQIAKELNVSPTPIKDALNLLNAEGFIVIKPRSGTFVAEFSETDLIETYELRMALEITAVRKLAGTITEEEIQALGQACENITLSSSSEDERGEHLRRNIVFHELLVELAGNKKMFDIYRNLNTFIQIYRVHYRTQYNWPKRVKKEREEHLKIIEALREKDSQKAVAAVAAHLNRGLISLREDIASVQSEQRNELSSGNSTSAGS